MAAPGPEDDARALAVTVSTATEPTLCAKKDNVYLTLQSDAARRSFARGGSATLALDELDRERIVLDVR